MPGPPRDDFIASDLLIRLGGILFQEDTAAGSLDHEVSVFGGGHDVNGEAARSDDASNLGQEHRKIFDVLPSVAGRVGAPPHAHDSLPAFTGVLEIVAGPLLMAGLFVRQAAWIVAIEAMVAYVLVAQPRAFWPIRNGGIEALLYAAVMLYVAVAGPGAWTANTLLRTPASRRAASAAVIPPT